MTGDQRAQDAMRQDRFEVGDAVRLIPTDEYLGGPVQEGHWAKHGRGPYIVEEVEDVLSRWGEHALADVKHTQLVTVCGETLSGYWLEPIQRDERSAA